MMREKTRIAARKDISFPSTAGGTVPGGATRTGRAARPGGRAPAFFGDQYGGENPARAAVAFRTLYVCAVIVYPALYLELLFACVTVIIEVCHVVFPSVFKELLFKLINQFAQEAEDFFFVFRERAFPAACVAAGDFLFCLPAFAGDRF